ITADCPLIDPQLMDYVIEAFYSWGIPNSHSTSINEQMRPFWDFAANRLPPPWKRTYPIGLDTEVCTFAALERAWREAQKPYHREHVLPYIYDPAHSIHISTLDNSSLPAEIPPGYFKVLVVDHDPDYGHYRWTVDTPQDLILLRKLYAFFNNQDNMSWEEVLQLFLAHPELEKINEAVKPKNVIEVDQRGIHE
ncbi:MAG: hypothetical protein ACPL3P_08765, partial [Anaerolineales bacterium]